MLAFIFIARQPIETKRSDSKEWRQWVRSLNKYNLIGTQLRFFIRIVNILIKEWSCVPIRKG